jgi:hypothetical protein
MDTLNPAAGSYLLGGFILRSELGHSRPNLAVRVMSGLPPVATVGADIPVRQLRANFGSNGALTQCTVRRDYRGLSFSRKRVDAYGRNLVR